MSNKPTLDSIIEEYACIDEHELGEDKFCGHYDRAQVKRELSQLIADIIGEDEIDRTAYDSPEHWRLIGAKDLRAEQRQRAKERGVDL